MAPKLTEQQFLAMFDSASENAKPADDPDADWQKLLALQQQQQQRQPTSQPSMFQKMSTGIQTGVQKGTTMARDSLLGLVKQFEAFRSHAYLPTKDDVPTLGYGMTKGVKMGDTISEPEATQMLNEHLDETQNHVKSLVKVPLNKNQLDAITSLVYNVGTGAFARSQALKALNAGDVNTFKNMAFGEDHGFVFQAGKKLQGLVNRRQKEQELFDTEEEEGQTNA